jgi:cation diffusion facilitator family transporter
MDEKVKVARLSIISNLFLTLGKLAVGFSMHSVSVISEAIHSGLDLVAALVTFYSVRKSSQPADESHPYGHGKYENLASIVEALLIIAAAVMIIKQALPRLSGQGEIYSLDLGLMVMAVSSLVNYFISSKLMSVARAADSPALFADAWHLRTDVYTSLGVFAGILSIKLTGIKIIDPLVAIAVAGLILKAAWDLIKESMASMLDASLPEEEEKAIQLVLGQYSNKYLEYHRLRTRKSGAQRYIDLHLVVPKCSVIIKSHELCDQIEKELKSKLPHIEEVLIHIEPCEEKCEDCRIDPGKSIIINRSLSETGQCANCWAQKQEDA